MAVAPGASTTVLDAASTLAHYLGQITGRHLDVRVPQGVDAKLPQIKLETNSDGRGDVSSWVTSAPVAAETYVIRSEPERLLILAATDHEILSAVWDFLHQVGYRRYFPGATWQVIPHASQLEIQTERTCRAAFRQRRLFLGAGAYRENKAEFAEWSRENRLGGLEIVTNHSYQKIVAANPAAFAAHPEYLGDGRAGKSPKFCVTAPGLVELVKGYAAQYFAQHPDSISISMEPSDQGGWEGCPGDTKLGSPTNRAVTLANAVARSLQAGSGAPHFVGMLAYYEHSSPPTLPIEPNVAVFVATAFSRSGLDFMETFRAWQAAGLRPGGTWMGVHDYYSVNAWDRDLPGQAASSSPSQIVASLETYHSAGAQLFDAEIGDGWAPNGLGYWIAAATLWNADRSPVPSSYVDDFLSHAFGRARHVMSRFYESIDQSAHPLLCSEFVGELYRLLERARVLEPKPAVAARLDVLAEYLHYLDLWIDYAFEKGSGRQSAFEKLMVYSYRIRRTHMVDSFALRRDASIRDREIVAPDPALWRDTAAEPWRDETLVTQAEIQSWIRAATRRAPLPPARQLDRVDSLVRLSPHDLHNDRGLHGITLRGQQRFNLLLDPAVPLHLVVRGGDVRAIGEVRIALCPSGATIEECQHTSVPADRADHEVSFQLPGPGHYELDVDDTNSGVDLSWAAGTPIVIAATARALPALRHSWTMYVYVPAGTRELVLYSSGGTGVLRGPDGTIAHRFTRRPGVIRIPVPRGHDALIWKFENNSGYRLPLNIPAWLAASPEELLVPARVLPELVPHG
ncbi:MAG TPA: DUF4838 domain-containing protein [Polyangiaceae bacterium]|nr:DUF4838 domain-containing protein [Polyangiaceae bacterium]